MFVIETAIVSAVVGLIATYRFIDGIHKRETDAEDKAIKEIKEREESRVREEKKAQEREERRLREEKEGPPPPPVIYPYQPMGIAGHEKSTCPICGRMTEIDKNTPHTKTTWATIQGPGLPKACSNGECPAHKTPHTHATCVSCGSVFFMAPARSAQPE